MPEYGRLVTKFVAVRGPSIEAHGLRHGITP